MAVLISIIYIIKNFTYLRNLGVHIDGYIALVAHTVVVGDKPVDARKAYAMRHKNIWKFLYLTLLYDIKFFENFFISISHLET